jgi:acyl dehydratase
VSRAFEDIRIGDELPARPRAFTREDVKAYADASGDHNPLHQDDDVARAAGFPGVIAHGMLTMGHLASCVLDWAGEGASLVRMRAQFRAPVLVGETIVAGGTVRALEGDRRAVTLDVWVRLERDGAVKWPIRRGEAEIELA